MIQADTGMLSGGRRSSLEIMIDLLYAARQRTQHAMQTDGGGTVSKRRIMRSANLNHDQLTNYLGALEDRGFVTVTEMDDGLYLEITDKGNELLARTEELIKLLDP